MIKKYFDQLSGAHSTQKQVEMHNNWYIIKDITAKLVGIKKRKMSFMITGQLWITDKTHRSADKTIEPLQNSSN